MSTPTWVYPSELLKHFRKHGHKLPVQTVQEYERFIMSHYPPDRGEQYVRDRPASTYS
jgi:hypothetical protein